MSKIRMFLGTLRYVIWYLVDSAGFERYLQQWIVDVEMFLLACGAKGGRDDLHSGASGRR